MAFHEILESDDSREINYVYHMSDIHIRDADRDVEYIQVFEKMYADIKSHIGKNSKKSLIVVTGDILHTRIHAQAQALDIAKYFFELLMKLTDVIIIAGNHDCNMLNSDSSDPLSVIISDTSTVNIQSEYIAKRNTKNSTSLYYLKNTGFYQFHNIVFGLTSVYGSKILSLDEMDSKWFKSIKHKNIYKIGLFHGTIYGSFIDSGRKMFDRKINIGEFDGYDRVMLGDIHKYQYLNKQKTIAYAGSLIQQSFGETIENHGYLLWCLKENKSQHYEVFNEYGFCTIEITNGKMDNKIVIPKKPFIRIRLNNTTEDQANLIEQDIKEKYQVQQYIKDLLYGSKLLSISSNNSNINGTKKDHMFLNILTQYMEHKKYDKDIIDSMVKLHKKIYLDVEKNAGNNNFKRSESWEILELRFSNMICYGEDNVIDFTKYESGRSIGIIAKNHSGKSAIVDIILFCLFGKWSRGDVREIMNRDKKVLSCSLKFKMSNGIYTIIRTGTRSCAGDANKKDNKYANKYGIVRTSIESFYLTTIDGTGKSVIRNLAGSDKRKTQQKICELVGNYDDYVNTCICLQQTGAQNFIEMNQNARKIYLQKLLNLDMIESCRAYASKNSSAIASQLKLLDKKNIVDAINNERREIKTLQNIICKTKQEMCFLEDCKTLLLYDTSHNKPVMIKYNELREYDLSTIDNISNCISLLLDKIDQIQKMDNHVIIQNNILNCENNVKNISEKIESLSNDRNKLSSKLRTIPKKYNSDINTMLSDKKSIEDELKSINKYLDNNNKLLSKKLSQDIDALKCNINKLESKLEPVNPKCQERLSELKNERDDIRKKVGTKTYIDVNIAKHEIMVKDKFVNHLNDINSKIISCTGGKSSAKNNPLNDIIACNNQWIDEYDKWRRDTQKYIKNNAGHVNDAILAFQISSLEKEIEHTSDETTILERNKSIQKNIDQQKSSLKEMKNMLQHQNNRDLLTDKLSRLEYDIEQYDINTKFIKKNESLNDKIRIIDTKITELSADRDKSKHQLSILKSDKKSNKCSANNLSVLFNHLKLLREYELIFTQWSFNTNEYNAWNNQIIDIDRRIKCISDTLIEFSHDLKYHRDKLSDLNGENKQYIALTEKKIMYDRYISITEYKHGIQCFMINKFLEPLTIGVNEILASIVSFTAEFVLKNTGGKNDLYVYMNEHNKKSGDFISGSGFQKFIAGLAIRITLTRLSNSAKPNFFIIDEGWSCMDDENRNNIFNVIKQIEGLYDHMIIISHFQEIKNQIQYPINIVKNNGFSSVKNIACINNIDTPSPNKKITPRKTVKKSSSKTSRPLLKK